MSTFEVIFYLGGVAFLFALGIFLAKQKKKANRHIVTMLRELQLMDSATREILLDYVRRAYEAKTVAELGELRNKIEAGEPPRRCHQYLKYRDILLEDIKSDISQIRGF